MPLMSFQPFPSAEWLWLHWHWYVLCLFLTASRDLVATFFTAFDPELKITAVTGKVFDGQEARIEALRRMPEIAVF